MNVVVNMNPVAATGWDDTELTIDGEPNPKYDFSAVDPLALMIWWGQDETTWTEGFSPDRSTMIQRLITIAEEGADHFDKLIPGMALGLPEEYKAEAKATRDYFTNKFVMLGLKEEMPISKTRAAMHHVLTTNVLAVNELVLMSRIHDFYLEDQFVERMVAGATNVDSNQFPSCHTVDQVYTVLGNNRRITKQAKLEIWWMKGESDNTLLRLSSPTNATTNSLVNQMLAPGRRWHIKSNSCGVHAIMGHRDFNTKVLTHGYKLSEAPDSA